MSQRPAKSFGRRTTAAMEARHRPVAPPPAAQPLPQHASNLLKEISIAVVMIAAIGVGFSLHAASLADALATLRGMTRIEVLSVMAGLMVPWVLLRALCGLPLPEFGRKPKPATDSRADVYDFDASPSGGDGGD